MDREIEIKVRISEQTYEMLGAIMSQQQVSMDEAVEAAIVDYWMRICPLPKDDKEPEIIIV